MFFDGEEHLADAGALLLEHPEVHAVVVHNVGKAALFALGRQPDLRGAIAREALFSDAPHVAALDTYVQAHHTASPIANRYSLTPISQTQRILTRSGSIGLHYDTPFQSDIYAPIGSFEGPLTLSVRIDTTPAMRIFQVLRTHTPILSPSMTSPPDKHAQREVHRSLAAVKANRKMLHNIFQQPGDAVIIANYPTPTIHAVQASPEQVTRSMIASYLLSEAL